MEGDGGPKQRWGREREAVELGREARQVCEQQRVGDGD